MTAIRAPAAVVVDIEGTVGSIRFVKDVLFPFARSRLRQFVLANRSRPDVVRELDAVRTETGIADVEGQIAQRLHPDAGARSDGRAGSWWIFG